MPALIKLYRKNLNTPPEIVLEISQNYSQHINLVMTVDDCNEQACIALDPDELHALIRSLCHFADLTPPPETLIM